MCKLFATITEEQGEVGEDLTGDELLALQMVRPSEPSYPAELGRDLFLRDSL